MPLDPLSALSVAASIIQFVDFSSEIISKGKYLYNSSNGVLKENEQTETVTVRLQEMTRKLNESLRRSRINNPTTTQVPADPELQVQHERLKEICQECSDASKELISRLGKLKVPTQTENRKWKSFRQALKSVWSKEAVDAMAKRLELLRNELDSQMLVLVRENLSGLSIKQDRRFSMLDQNTHKIINTLLEVDSTQKEQLCKEFGALADAQKAEHAKTRAAFVSMDGKKRRVRVELALLESLKFPEMNYRHERIANTHGKTFLWAFRDPNPFEKPWDNFTEWLSSKSGIYWIQGKAASGKSTLMRFIWRNQLTLYNLQRWSRGSQLAVAAFFFWNSGVPEQCSQLGLLRSLLFEMLNTQRALIPHVFLEQWRHYTELAAHDLPIPDITWSLAQLQGSFRRLIESANQMLKLCFFIDGLDEYEGDSEGISEYFKDLSLCSEHAKFCLSSRPWPIFHDIYQGVPGLRVQDMTHDDIKIYVEEKLEKNWKMQELLDENPEEASGLINELVNKADGVFLWVELVVKSLINGLRNGDGIKHLRRRLEQIPPDIESLYEHIVKSIDPFDLEEASQIFQVFRASGHDLDIPTLERALRNSNHRIVLEMRITPAHATSSEPANNEASLRRMALRLNSRCKGLLEALKDDPVPTPKIDLRQTGKGNESYSVSGSIEACQGKKRKRNLSLESSYPHVAVKQRGIRKFIDISDKPTSESDDSLAVENKGSESGDETSTVAASLRISYLHRTARDYLEQPPVWSRLLEKTQHTDFDPCESLLKAYIAELKATALSRAKFQRATAIGTKVESFTLSSQSFIALTAELQRVISSHWWGEEVQTTSHWTDESLDPG